MSRSLLGLALALSLGAAVSLGVTRFAYGLLLPPMRADLGWSYTLAGAMNTANALGYLLGALATPVLLRRQAPGRLLLGGAVLATVFFVCTLALAYFGNARPASTGSVLESPAATTVPVAPAPEAGSAAAIPGNAAPAAAQSPAPAMAASGAGQTPAK